MAVTGSDMAEESIFTWGAPPLKFGPGAVDEIGFDMAQHGARRVLILTDPRINELAIPARVADSLARYGISSEIFDGGRGGHRRDFRRLDPELVR
jgi:hydroxyacid-oxoacid transhydrogenase